MKIAKNREVPTGNILVVQGEKGLLECLSIGDYGKDHNLKADFLGLDRQIEGQVEHAELLPLEKKWVITISSQYGCSIGCNFCDVPKVGRGKNATVADMIGQVEAAISLHPEVKYSERLNIHVARMGEPTFNIDNVIEAIKHIDAKYGDVFKIHPVLSTMFPRNGKTIPAIKKWLEFKNDYFNGNAGLQLSIQSTDKNERRKTFNDKSANYLDSFLAMRVEIPKPKGRKITLNFALADYTIDADYLRSCFCPDWFLCKLTPMHKTAIAIENDIKTKGDYTTYYPYQKIEEELKAVGFEVIVFIASKEEDESKITCGNAILAEGKTNG